jgi:hypothetical protein
MMPADTPALLHSVICVIKQGRSLNQLLRMVNRPREIHTQEGVHLVE